MKPGDGKKITALIILLAVFPLTLAYGRRVNPPATVAAVSPQQVKPEGKPAAPNDARIRLDLVEKESKLPPAGRENVFQYRVRPPAPTPPPKAPQRGNPFPGSPTTVTPPVNTAPAGPTGPPPPPPPPPINLKYQGYARNDAPNGGLIAFLADDAGHYNVKAGDVLMGRFRIVGVTDSAVDVQDLQFNRRQTIPLLK